MESLPEGSRASDDNQNQFLNGGKLDDAVPTKIQALRPIADRHSITMSQLALAWCLRKPEISSVIIGASKPAQVTDNAGASGVSLSEEDIAEMDAALA